jgi:hypothetical protein
MSRLTVVAAAVLLVPALAFAQSRGGRGMGGSKEADWNEVTKDIPKGPTISGKDFAEASPLAMLLDKKKDLKLTEAQVGSITEAETKLQSDNAARFAIVDSLKKAMKPSIAPTAEDEARVALSREAMMGVVRDIRGSFDAASKASVGSLDADQQKKAEELLGKHAEKMQKMLREKMGGGGPGMGGGRGRGGSD